LHHRHPGKRAIVLPPGDAPATAVLPVHHLTYLRAHPPLFGPADDAWRGVEGAMDGMIAFSRVAAQ
jgi:hypothetical protein